MKRLWIILSLLLLAGCNNDAQIDLYEHFLKVVNSYKSSDVSRKLPFDIKVNLNKIIDSEITYRVIIDNPEEPIKNIKVIAVHNYETKDVYPTAGIFEEALNLLPNKVDLSNNDVKGIILVGYIDYDGDIDSFDGTVKILIQYDDLEGNNHKKYYEYHK